MVSKRQERLQKQGQNRKLPLARLIRQAAAVARKEQSGLALVLVKDAEDWNQTKVTPPDVGMVTHMCINGDVIIATRFVVHYLVYQILHQLKPDQVDDTAQRLRAEINVTIESIVESILAGDEEPPVSLKSDLLSEGENG